MNLHRLTMYAKNIATLGSLGYLPAPGTVGTLATIPLVCILKLLHLPLAYEIGSIIVVSMFSYLVISLAKRQLTTAAKDPQQIIIDEVSGCLWAFCTVELSIKNIVIGFLLFRFFDIQKPFGIAYLEKIPGPLGILMDDIAAGWATALLLLLFSL